MNILSKTKWLGLGALVLAMPVAADPRESRVDDPTCAQGGTPAVLVHVSGLKNGAGQVRVQAYGPGAAKYLKVDGRVLDEQVGNREVYRAAVTTGRDLQVLNDRRQCDP